MALTARRGDIQVIDRRLCVVRSDNLMRTTVTIHASGRGRAGLRRLGVQAVAVSLLCIAVAISAGYLFGCRRMDKTLDILMTVDARKHRAVDRMIQLIAVHVETDLLAVDLVAQCRVAMACETVFVLRLMLGVCRAHPHWPEEHQENCEISTEGHVTSVLPAGVGPQ